MTTPSMKADDVFTYLAAGLIAFAERGWQYPYPPTLERARGELTGANLLQGAYKFQSMSDFLRMLHQPLKSWWPLAEMPSGIDPDLYVLDTDLQIATHVEDYLLDLDDLSRTNRYHIGELKAVLDNRKMRDICRQVSEHPDLQAAYVALRRYLIEHPWLDAGAGLDIPSDVTRLMGKVADFYEPPSPNMLHAENYWMCPRCGGLLWWKDGRPQCAKPGLCDILTRSFEGRQARRGDLRTLKLTHRKRVQLPGLPELELYHQLSQMGLKAALWPDGDRYDLQIEFPDGEVWAVDVKDYASEYTLARQLQNVTPPTDPQITQFYYVIPDHREQLSPGYTQRLAQIIADRGIQVCLDNTLVRAAYQKLQ